MKTFALGFVVFACALSAMTMSSPAHAGQAVAECYVVDVATFDNRVHIHCQTPVTACSLSAGGTACAAQGIPPTYVAVESTSPMASSVVQVGLAAFTSKRILTVFFDDDTGANPAGCNENDCRRIIGVMIH